MVRSATWSQWWRSCPPRHSRRDDLERGRHLPHAVPGQRVRGISWPAADDSPATAAWGSNVAWDRGGGRRTGLPDETRWPSRPEPVGFAPDRVTGAAVDNARGRPAGCTRAADPVPVRALTTADRDEALEVCARNPAANVFVAARIEEGRCARRRAPLLGFRSGGRLRSLCWVSANVVPVESATPRRRRPSPRESAAGTRDARRSSGPVTRSSRSGRSSSTARSAGDPSNCA